MCLYSLTQRQRMCSFLLSSFLSLIWLSWNPLAYSTKQHRTMRTMTLHCWKSFLPKMATSGSTIWNSLVTTCGKGGGGPIARQDSHQCHPQCLHQITSVETLARQREDIGGGSFSHLVCGVHMQYQEVPLPWSQTKRSSAR